MAIVKKLPRDIAAMMVALNAKLESFIDAQEEARERRSEAWLDGEAGTDHGAWLDDLRNVVDALDAASLEVKP